VYLPIYQKGCMCGLPSTCRISEDILQ
jgi:hypothetical protein